MNDTPFPEFEPRERSDCPDSNEDAPLSKYEQEKLDGTRRLTGAIKLKELSGKHLRAINMHMAGAKGREIASTLDMTEGWVSIVLNDPLAQAEIHARFVDADNEMFAKATGVLDRSMDSEDPAIALRSAEMVWRSRGKFDKREPVRTSAEDVVQRMLELAAKEGTASVTISATTGDGTAPAHGIATPPANE